MKQILKSYTIFKNTVKCSFLFLDLILRQSFEGVLILKLWSVSKKVVVFSSVLFILITFYYFYFSNTEINSYVNDINDYRDCNLYLNNNYNESSNNCIYNFLNLFQDKSNFYVPSYFLENNFIKDHTNIQYGVELDYKWKYNYILYEYDKLMSEYVSFVDDMTNMCNNITHKIVFSQNK